MVLRGRRSKGRQGHYRLALQDLRSTVRQGRHTVVRQGPNRLALQGHHTGGLQDLRSTVRQGRRTRVHPDQHTRVHPDRRNTVHPVLHSLCNGIQQDEETTPLAWHRLKHAAQCS